MPFTLLHVGPGMAVKSITGNHFSVLMFALAQVAIDIEPGLGMLRDADTLHGWTHTYVGATIIAVLVVAIGRPVCLAILRRWNAELRHHRLDWLESPEAIGWFPAAAGALLGTYSHVLLDSIMHADMRPLLPFSNLNTMLSLLSFDALHVLCVVTGLGGLAVWVGLKYFKQRSNASP